MRSEGDKVVLKAFLRDRAGNFAMMAAIAAVPVMVSVGLAIDYAGASRSQARMQRIADITSLALASSRLSDKAAVQKMADNLVKANATPAEYASMKIASLTTSNDQVSVRLNSTYTPNFAGLMNLKQVDLAVKSVASRSMVGSVEVALVLDNTWSMSEADAKGVKKIDALKSAGKALVDQLFANEGADVRVAVVPYADYVNVGTENRNASWLSVPADSSVTTPESCKEVSSEQVCVKSKPSYTCTSTTDGVTTTGTCGGGCETYETRTYDPPQRRCTKASTTNYKWFGCVGSRLTNSARLSDASPSTPYPGYTTTSQGCPTPILTMNTIKTAVQAKVAAMTPNIGGYKPSTYIPAGLIWGLNVLSPSAPFTDGAAYDPSNRKPRKVMVLMTDGDNTMRYNNNAKNGADSTDGTHKGISFNSDGTLSAASAKQVAATNADTASLCDTIKSNDRAIEVFTVALMVDNDDAKTMLQNCASNSKGTFDHYYPADDSAALAAAFNNIGQKLSVVRLVE